MTPYRIITTEWVMNYPVQPSTPIGVIRREDIGFVARCFEEDLGVFGSGDGAAEAIWIDSSRHRGLDTLRPQARMEALNGTPARSLAS